MTTDTRTDKPSPDAPRASSEVRGPESRPGATDPLSRRGSPDAPRDAVAAEQLSPEDLHHIVLRGEKRVRVGGIYRHKKGAVYQVEAVAVDSGTLAAVVVYRDFFYGEKWVRSLEEFADGRFTLLNVNRAPNAEPIAEARQ